MKGSRALGILAASATASLPLLASAPSAGAAPREPLTVTTRLTASVPRSSHQRIATSHRSKAGSRLFAAARRRATKLTAPWLPTGCKMVEIGPASAGYTAAQRCASPKGFHLRRGYMLVRGSIKPSVHTTTGASG